MSEVVAPEYLPAEQAEMVRELYEAFNEFETSVESATALDQKKHWNVVTKFITLSLEFPAIAAIANQHYENPDNPELDAEGLFETDAEAVLYWLFFSLREFANTHDIEKLDYVCSYVEENLIEMARFCEEYDVQKRTWK